MRVLSFLLRHHRLALPLHSVREVVEDMSLSVIPGAPDSILGAMNLRGRVVAVVDLLPWVGGEKPSESGDVAEADGRFFVVVAHPQASLALQVHHVENISTVLSQSSPPPASELESVGKTPFQIVASVAQLSNGETAKILDVDAVLQALQTQNLQRAIQSDMSQKHP